MTVTVSVGGVHVEEEDCLTHIFTVEELDESKRVFCSCGRVACSNWNGNNVCVDCQDK